MCLKVSIYVCNGYVSSPLQGSPRVFFGGIVLMCLLQLKHAWGMVYLWLLYKCGDETAT